MEGHLVPKTVLEKLKAKSATEEHRKRCVLINMRDVVHESPPDVHHCGHYFTSFLTQFQMGNTVPTNCAYSFFVKPTE